MPFASVERALDLMREGKMIILVDDEDKEGVADAIIDDIVEVGEVVKQWLQDGDNSAKTP